MKISEHRLSELFTNFRRKTVAVVGDVMLDRYFWGNVKRISPEAPVPVVDVESESARLGGAANVANNIRSLGGKALLVGVVGEDASGANICELMKNDGFSVDGILLDSARPTTVKTRIIAHNQHVVRIDRESRTPLAPSMQKRLLDFVHDQLDTIDTIILEDYNKGVVGKNIIVELIKLATKHDKPITADPKFNNFFEYKGVTVFKPNMKETEEALGIRIRSDKEIENAGKELLMKLQASNILLTQGERGMTLFEHDGSSFHVSAIAHNVADVSGAGDTVISTLSLALAGGASIREAAILANFAGGVVCGEVGVVPITRDKLQDIMLRELNYTQTD